MAQPVAGQVKKSRDQFSKTIVLLKKENYERRNGKAYMPTLSELADIKKPNRGQYKKNVWFSTNMSEDMVRQKLQETFPTFDLTNGRFSCAAVSQDSITFQFHGTPRIWDGKTTRENIKGNSVLYIVMEDNQVPQHYSLATDGSYMYGSTDLNPSENNNIPNQMNGLPNTVNVHEQTTLHNVYEDIAEMSLNVESVMETEGSQQVTAVSLEDIALSALAGQNIMPLHSQALPSARTSATNTDMAPHDSTEMMFTSDSSGENNSSSEIVTTSGISGTDFDFSSDDVSVNHWKPKVVQFEVSSVIPERVPLQGGNFCCFNFNGILPRNVQSGFAMFGHLGTVNVKRCGDNSLVGMMIPPAQEPGWVTVTLKSHFGIPLGEIKILYIDEEKEFLQRIVNEPSLQCKLLRELEANEKTTGGGETQNPGDLGFTQHGQVLRLLVYAAAESGAQQFIEMIFSSSAARMVFDSYKDRPVLPEVIAKDHGNEETAHYLGEITKRFSEELRTEKEYSQTIDWSELVKAAEAVQKQHDITGHKERNITKETGYLADADTSSNESLEAPSSDSEDDNSTTSKKEIKTEAEKCKQPDWVHEGHAIKANMTSLSQTQSPICFFKDGNFQEKQLIVKIKPLSLEQNCLHLVKDHHIQEAHNLRQVKSLHRSGISFLLGLGKESVQRHLITAYQRLSNLLKLAKERNTYWQMHADTAEENSSTVPADNDYHKSSSIDSLLQLYCKHCFEGPEYQNDCFVKVTTTPSEEEIAARSKSLDCPNEEHRYSGTFDFWVLTYIFRPTRKILFVYVSDKQDVFPHESCFKDEKYEVLMQCWQGLLCRNNSTKVKERLQEMHEISELQQLAEPPPDSQVIGGTMSSDNYCQTRQRPPTSSGFLGRGRMAQHYFNDAKIYEQETMGNPWSSDNYCQTRQRPPTSSGFLGRRRKAQHYSSDVKIYVQEITAQVLERELLRRCGNEGQHPYLDATGYTTLRFLRTAISFIPDAQNDGTDMRNAAFILAQPGQEFLIQAGNGDWEFSFAEEKDGQIYGRCVRKPFIHYLWNGLNSRLRYLPREPYQYPDKTAEKTGIFDTAT